MDFLSKSFDELTLRELHDLLKLRFDVFILEQRSLYPDIDGLDPESVHLLGVEDGRIEACARIGDRPVRLHGQEHLARFYESFGFATEAGPFDEDGIPHLVMLRS